MTPVSRVRVSSLTIRPNAPSDPSDNHSVETATRYLAAEAFLYDRINYEKLRGSAKRYPFRLDLMRHLVAAMGYADALASPSHAPLDPEFQRAKNQKRPLLIHVGGTKGKGSVSTMVAALMMKAGFKVGLYTSPHVETLRERFQIDLSPCSETDLIGMVDRLSLTVDSLETTDTPRASFFELTTAGAYDLFRRQGCDAVVLEVGLGGRLDSTNVFQSDVSVITTIGLDHQNVLGNTHAAIAGEKAGIIKPGVPVISGVTRPDAWSVIHQRALENGSSLYQLGQQLRVLATPHDDWGSSVQLEFDVDETTCQSFEFELPLEGDHQARNSALAMAATWIAGTHIGFERLHDSLLSTAPTDAMDAVCPLGRLECYHLPQKVLLDSAHNEDSIEALLAVIRRRHTGPVTFVFGTSVDKSSARMLEQISPLADRIVLTRFTENPRWLDPETLAKQIPANHSGKVDVIADPQAALDAALEPSDENPWVVICGSFFLAAELRPRLRRSSR